MRLSGVLAVSKKSLDETKTTITKYKSELDSLAKIGGTETEISVREGKIVELEKKIYSYEKELKQLTGAISTLKSQLKKSTGNAEECSKLQAESTKSMKEFNDLLITEFDLEYKSLAKRLRATRNSVLSLLTTYKDLVCKDQNMEIWLAFGVMLMKDNSEKMNRLCEFKRSAENSHGINMLFNESDEEDGITLQDFWSPTG